MMCASHRDPPPEEYISKACERELTAHGDSFRGAGYTRSKEEAEAQYARMLEVVRETSEPVSVLDLGCGLAHMLDHIKGDPRYAHIRYSGLEISPAYFEKARARHPDADIMLMDVLESDEDLPAYDYVIMNGLFNYKGEIPFDTMVDYWKTLTTRAWDHSRKGIAFNVMSTLVDWQRDDLFHLPIGYASEFVWKELSRHFEIRHDYPSFEYTVYVYRAAG